MRLLCISDIHGRADALSAVLATAERFGFDKLLVAGDLCFPGPEPLATWQRLAHAGAICAQGTSDRALATLDLGRVVPKNEHERARLARLEEVRRELGDFVIERLAELPPLVRLPMGDGGELVLVHGSPADPMESLSHDMSDDELLALLGDDPADLVICGGSHVPFDREVGGVRIINVGSVGEAPSASGASLYADATLIDLPRAPSASSEPLGLLRVERLVVPLHDYGHDRDRDRERDHDHKAA